MKRDDSYFLRSDEKYIDMILFSTDDPEFVEKYALLSIFWSKLIQLRITIIAIVDDQITLRIKNYPQDSEVILNTYLEDVRNVFTTL